MTNDIDELHARADALEPTAYAEAVAIYEEILRSREGELLATRGLALALVKLGELDRAEEVVQEALTLHPGDPLLLRRIENIASDRRWAAQQSAAAKGRARTQVSRARSTWIKAIHYDDAGWDQTAGDELWLSDPGQRDANGDRLYTAAGEPWGRPSWRVGEEAGVYFSGTHRVPVLVQIIKAPEFNPAFVQAADWAKDDDGERWPWVTWVRVLKAVEVEDAPTLEHLGIATASMQQRARLLTNTEIHTRLSNALSDG